MTIHIKTSQRAEHQRFANLVGGGKFKIYLPHS